MNLKSCSASLSRNLARYFTPFHSNIYRSVSLDWLGLFSLRMRQIPLDSQQDLRFLHNNVAEAIYKRVERDLPQHDDLRANVDALMKEVRVLRSHS